MRYIKLDEKWLNKLRETAHFYSADIVCGAGTDWILKTAEAENKTLFEIISYLENAPSEDVAEVRHGEWEVDAYKGDEIVRIPYKVHQHDEPYCSLCGTYALLDGKEDYVPSNFCPECGACMDGGKE